jgi:hypothetical protein
MDHRAPESTVEPTVLSSLTALLRRFLPDYLRLVEPDCSQHLRLDRLALLDLPSGAPPLDGVVAEVLTCRDEPVTVLVLVEPEPLSPAATRKLFGGWLQLLELRYRRPVLLNVIYLRGGRPGINLESTSAAAVGTEDVLRLFYSTFGLSWAGATYYLQRPEPIAWALAALMAFPSGSRDEHCDRCKARIATAESPRLGAPDRALLAHLVDTVRQAAGSGS